MASELDNTIPANLLWKREDMKTEKQLKIMHIYVSQTKVHICVNDHELGGTNQNTQF